MKRIASFLVALLIGLPSIASADAISMDFTGAGKGGSVNISGIGWVFAGELNWTLDSGAHILSFCVDLNNALGDPQSAVAESMANLTGATSNAGKKVAYLYNSYFENSSKSNALAAATQVAIWKILEGSSFQLLGSTISNLGGMADALVLQASVNYATGNTNATWLNVDPLGTGRYKGQDQVTRTVPEPGTLLLFGVAALVLAAKSRRALKSE